jgi:ABC-2 type transport system ATP-binding protein
MNLICFNNIFKSYNPGLFKKKILAIKDLSFDLQQGEVFGLIGPNGAGKSTAIRMLLGLIRADSGTIFYRGAPLSEMPIQQDVGYLPENPYLYDHLNLRELLTFCGRASGLAASAISERGTALMTKLNLLEAQKRPLRTFSKGMLQRAGICFALLHDPDIVILDEPMSGLDPIGRRMVFDLVMELKEEGKTIFFCSHILNDVERLCDRIGVMVGGRLLHILGRENFADNSSLPLEEIFMQAVGECR